MTATISVSDIKYKGRARDRNRIPRGGSQLREVFDYLQANRGVWVPTILSRAANNSSAYEQLRNFYGLDIRIKRVPVFENGTQGWKKVDFFVLLAGEWDGRVYLDYVANPELRSTSNG
jgi:hypothetical protein